MIPLLDGVVAVHLPVSGLLYEAAVHVGVGLYREQRIEAAVERDHGLPDVPRKLHFLHRVPDGPGPRLVVVVGVAVRRTRLTERDAGLQGAVVLRVGFFTVYPLRQVPVDGVVVLPQRLRLGREASLDECAGPLEYCAPTSTVRRSEQP